jgi:hypothetical protein
MKVKDHSSEELKTLVQEAVEEALLDRSSPDVDSEGLSWHGGFPCTGNVSRRTG